MDKCKDIWCIAEEKYERIKENERNKRRIRREAKARKTKCDNCGKYGAYPFDNYKDGYRYSKLPKYYRANLCEECEAKLHARYDETSMYYGVV